MDPSPVITRFMPGHDSRILSSPSIPIELHFSIAMDCRQITESLQINSSTFDNQIARLDANSVRCQNISNTDTTTSPLVGTAVNTAWSFTATLVDVSDGIHQISLNNISTSDSNATTNSHDHFLLRVGQGDNPLVFTSSNHSSNMLFQNADNSLYVSHKAAGADMFRYSLNWGTTYSDWERYPNGTDPISDLAPRVWSGTKLQEWNGEHVIIQYWSQLVGSSDHVQSADFGIGSLQRQFPHLFLEGKFNQEGFDEGFPNQIQMKTNNTWTFDLVLEWPAQVSLNVWGINPDGQPDQTRVYGDIDADFVLDRIPPLSLINNVINITDPPPSPFLGWRIALNDANYRFQLIPVGSRWNQLILYVLLWVIPILGGAAAVWAFMKSFYGVKLNEVGITSKREMGFGILHRHFRRRKEQGLQEHAEETNASAPQASELGVPHEFRNARQFSVIGTPQIAAKRLTVLIATMEYDIEDWGIKVKIGGLGVMSSLMGKNLKHQDLIWVVPW